MTILIYIFLDKDHKMYIQLCFHLLMKEEKHHNIIRWHVWVWVWKMFYDNLVP
jgi:hypothetical protein